MVAQQFLCVGHEIKHKEVSGGEPNTDQLQSVKSVLNLTDVTAGIEALRLSIKVLTEASHAQKEDIAVIQCQMRSAEEDREKSKPDLSVGRRRSVRSTQVAQLTTQCSARMGWQESHREVCDA